MRTSIKHWFLVCSLMFVLRIPPNAVAANLVQNGGFETGNLSSWTLSGDPLNTWVSSGFSYSGFYGLLFSASNKLEFISQTLATSPGQAYTLSFWMGSGDSGGGVPNEFTVKWGDTTLLDQLDQVVPAWTNMQFKVTANSTATVLTFGGWDNLDYIYLDDVVVTIPSSNPPPQFVTSSVTNDLIRFVWSAVVGRDYQIQYASSLQQAIWINLGSPATATNATMVGTDSTSISSRRFYRVALLP